MPTVADTATRENAVNTLSVALAEEARSLANAEQDLERAAKSHPHIFELAKVAHRLNRARAFLVTSPKTDPALQMAAEWFLDNYYLIRLVARQVETELPREFMQHLPHLASGVSKGRPRIFSIAHVLVAQSRMTIDLALVERFITAYQEVSPLTIAELWALPTMLRAAVLEHLLQFLKELHVPVHETIHQTAKNISKTEHEAIRTMALDPGPGVEQSIRALRVLDAIDWKTFFEKTNRVEAILRTDPANIYSQMDFESCDAHRKIIERLAWETGKAEDYVANLAIALAHENEADDRKRLVSYYLVAEGRAVIEERLGYRPVGVERIRRMAVRQPTAFYLLPLALMTWLPVLIVAFFFMRAHADANLILVAISALIALVPVSAVVVTILQYTFARLLPPRILPKLDFKKGLPADARTLVVIPTLLGRDEDVANMLRQIELHYLSNPDSELQYALLTDDMDAKALPDLSDERPLLERAANGITALNTKHGKNGHGPFHLLHREPRWNKAEERFMGWERKRGKLEELNRLLRGDTKTTYSRHVGDPAGLTKIRFVITLDSDTEMPMGSARRLVGLLAHPLNRAVFDEKTGRVVAGYTVVQPRIETSPSSLRHTHFSRLFAGDVGFDIYTHACSELYQDLFGAGIYVGKGIYDVDAFKRSVDGVAPENALVSHDLFEGIHGRAALATDIVLFEDYPSSYATYAMRMHRWVRGDWQLLPWLLAHVPSARGDKLSNKLERIDRWKIADNLRRSLTGPFTFALLILGWTWLPGNAFLWTLLPLAIFLAPFLPSWINRKMRAENLGRAALAIVFLAHESAITADAIARVIVRKLLTQKHLLQWTTMAHAAFGTRTRSQRAMYWKTMIASPALAFAIALMLERFRPSSLAAASPLLALWFFAPEIARGISEPARSHTEHITHSERKKLRLIARRTWRFFDVFVGPNDQWLPVDNYQEEPHEQIAHRTSPTNIGLTLLATLSAYDFGYIGPSELSLRVRRIFDSVTRLQHYQGHLLNWYDTQNLQPLLPRYVSTVDSGNFAGCLLALKQGCFEMRTAHIVRACAWEGLRDSIDILEEAVESAPSGTINALRPIIAQMQQAATHGHDHLDDAYATLQRLRDETGVELDRALFAFLETGAHRHEADLLHQLRTSMDRFHQQLRQMRLELDTLLPWLALTSEAAALAINLPTNARLDEIPIIAKRFCDELDAKENERRQRGEESAALDEKSAILKQAFRSADANASALGAELEALATRSDDEVRGMDFKLLYDSDRKLFHIGYNATIDKVDSNYYDLLASEARLASYIAIVKRDVPSSHWYALGRPMTRLPGSAALLSWGGTMFEYLMPGLLMKSQPGTLLSRTCTAAVNAQIAYARKQDEPWGISESAYARVDANQTYQYRSFGVPGLGFKRGLEDDRVITPYASILAVSIRPHAVVKNINALCRMGMLGNYGLFEALDLTHERALSHGPEQPSFTVVRSYMAHHQGMLLVALGNALNERSMVERFHADPLIETGEELLNERAPDGHISEWQITTAPKITTAEGTPITHTITPSWSPSDQGNLQAFPLSNGRLTSVLTNSGGGGLRWRGLALTRYEPDATRDEDGIWFYLRDEETRNVWLATSPKGRTTYSLHKAEFHHRNEGISVHVDVAVATADDVEVRRVTLHNETNRPRRLTITSAGRPVLVDAKQAPVHPAFSSMFVESERVVGMDALLFARRTQSPEENPAVLVHRLVHEGPSVTFAGYESDRGDFFGRGSNMKSPSSLMTKEGVLHGRVGAMLDPIMSVMAQVDLAPKGSVTLAFVTTIGRSRRVAIDLARKYGSMLSVGWTFRDAEHESSRRLSRTMLEPELLPTVQRLFSALLFADSPLRVSRSARAAALPNQHRLWGRGISGDDPIVLVRVHDPAAPLLREIFSTQRFLRSCGVRLDLVLIDEQASGYATEGSGSLRNALIANDTVDWLNRHGGVYVIAADQVAESEVRHLEACARVVLDTRDGSLAARFNRTAEAPPKLPQFEPTLVDKITAPARQRLPLAFDNGTGGFTQDGNEYVIDVAPGKTTPAPWCNVLANPEFGCLVSESSLGMSWSQNAGENRLTPWRNDPVFDTPSEALYLRDEETADVWTPTPLPAGKNASTRVRHGAGYTTYERESNGLTQELTIFVPPDASLKVARLRVKNTLTRHRRLTATYYAEWVLGSRRAALRPYIVSEFDRDHASLLATCDWNEEFQGRVAFLASKNDAHGFTADRAEFLGHHGDYASPEALLRWGLSGNVDLGADPCAALQVHLELKPGEECETHFILGQSANRNEALELIARFRDKATIDASWTKLHTFWDGILGQVRVKTPEPSMDIMLNRWLLYQTLSSRVFGRTGFYQSSGAFGYRDQLQDVMSLLHADPQIARAHILESAKHQFEQGDVLHWWHPPSGRGVRTRCSDDLAWLPFVTSEYVAATGDTGILDEQIKFLEGEPLRADEHDRYAQYSTSVKSASLFDHCKKALEHATTEGIHGLPLMGDGDWNDGMNRIGAKGHGESVWLGWFLCATMDRFATLCSAKNDNDEAAHWQARSKSLRAKMKEVAWDGAWYLRAFHDDGSLVGSAKNKECRIDSIAQSWAVLSEEKNATVDARTREAMREADDQLVRETDRLVLLFWPPYDHTQHNPGYVRAYPPGIRENGGQYTHAATWLGFAYAKLGDGEKAERIFKLLNPILHATTAEASARYRIEPFALAGDVYGYPPWIGRGGWSWYTGAAAWMWRLGVEKILGIQKDNGHLRIDPCIPPTWKGFEAWVRNGEEQIHIVIENPEHVATGIAAITVDGVAQNSNRIDVNPSNPRTREVRVYMGTLTATRADSQQQLSPPMH